jgi:hypothetical protein
MLITPISFYVLEHFQEDHWIIAVEKMDKNQNPKFLNKQIKSSGVRFGFPFPGIRNPGFGTSGTRNPSGS